MKKQNNNVDKSAKSNPARNICIVTPHLIDHGPLHETAGAMSGLARVLSAAGNRVTLLFVPEFNSVDEGGINFLKDYFYDNHLIELDVLLEARDLLPSLTYPQKKSVAVYYYLKDRDFDGVYFALEGGLAYYSLIAVDTGMFEQRPEISVVAQSPLLWLSEADRFFLRNVDELSVHHMEKMSLELADCAVCLSEATKTWFEKASWKLPKKTDVITALLPSEWSNLPAIRDLDHHRNGPIREIALLALWNFRDGLTLVCDALDELSKDSPPDVSITAFGWFGQILGEHTGGMLVRRARRWPFRLQIFPHTSVRQILEYCASNNVLAVIPAWESASGYWVSACLKGRIPFVATEAGANGELVPAELKPGAVTKVSAKALSAAILQAIATPLPTPGYDDRDLRAKWIAHAKSMARVKPPVAPRKGGKLPLVSIVCVHFDRPHYLMQAIDAIEHQTYSNIEVILVDDGSRRPESKVALDRLRPRFHTKGWKIIEQENKYLGAARNAGVLASRGDYVLFVDDDNALFRDGVRQFVVAMETSGADICTAFHKVFHDDDIPISETLKKVHYLPLGGSLDLGLVQDSFGDANAMVRRSVFDNIGLQNDDYGYTANDWEFFARAELAGLKVRVIPEPLYWYRSKTEGMYRTSHWYNNRLPILEAYRKADFKGIDVYYHLAMSAFSPESEINGLRENLRQSESDRRYLKLAEMDGNGQEAVSLLAEIAAAEGRADTALTLLGAVNHNAFRYSAEERLGTEPLRGDAYKELVAGTQIPRAVSLDDIRRFETLSTISLDRIPLNYVEEPDKFFLQAREGETSVAVLPACCAEDTVSAGLTVSMDQELASACDVLVQLVPFHTDPVISVAAAGKTATPGSSGWIPISRGYTEVAIEALFSTPSTEPLSLLLAVRAREGSTASVLACFSKIIVKRAAADRMSRRPRLGAPPSKMRSRRLWPEEYQSAKLLTNYKSSLPALMFAPDKGGIFLRPSEAGPVMAIIHGGLPALARGLLARVEVAHEESSPFEFAMALCEPSKSITWVDGQPTAYAAFSGWVRVSECFKLIDVEARVQYLSRQKLDIVIAIRLPPGSKASPANAFWRQFIMLWDE